MLSSIKYFALAGLCLSLANCSLNPVNPSTAQTSTLDVRMRIISSPLTTALGKSLATTYDSLIIEATAADMNTKRLSMPLKNIIESTGDTIFDLPAGDNRRLTAYTKNRIGTRIHYAPEQIIDCTPGQSATVRFFLKPVRGSIFINLTDVPTTVDTVYASFSSVATPLWHVAVKKARETRISLSLDTIPDNMQGTLIIAGVTITNDTLYKHHRLLTFSSISDSSLCATFSETPGALSITSTIPAPGVTLISGSMTPSADTGRENGTILISEIMYAANDSEYIELYNPADTSVMFDTLIINKDGTDRVFTDITINAQGFFVIGRINLAWADAFHSSSTALDLSSTSGNTLTIKNKRGAIIDRLTFLSGSNSQEWLVVTGSKKSIALDTLNADPTYNNYGKHWIVSETLIDAQISLQYGTPGDK